MNLITDPGFEAGTGWDYYNGASRPAYPAVYPHGGTYLCDLTFQAFYIAPGFIEELDLPLVLGRVYSVSLWCMSNGASHGSLWVELDVGDGAYAVQASRSATVGDWELWNCGCFVALGATGRIRILGRGTVVVNNGWLVDDVVVMDTETGMAVKLAERSVDAVTALLIAQMATELTAIDADRADGITMTAPAATDYYKRPKGEIPGSTVSVEVFESDIEFTSPYTDPGAQRAVYTMPVTVRVTCRNTSGDDADTMMIRMRRYSTAVFNCVNKSWDLDAGDDALKMAVVNRVSSHWSTEGEDADKINKVQTTIELEVVCEETQA